MFDTSTTATKCKMHEKVKKKIAKLFPLSYAGECEFIWVREPRQFFPLYIKSDSRCLLIEERKRMNESACFTHVHTHAYPLLVGRPEIRGGYASSIYRIYTAGVTLLPGRPRSVQSNFMICIHLASRAPDLPLVVSVIVLFSLFFCSATPPLLPCAGFIEKRESDFESQ
jgi:hypothetical protein